MAPEPDPNGLGDLLGAPEGPAGPVPPAPPPPLQNPPFPPVPGNPGNGIGGTRLTQLNKPQTLEGTELQTQPRKPVAGEWLNAYVTALNALKPASQNLDGHAGDWADLHRDVIQAHDDFRDWLNGTLNDADGWRGATATAIVHKALDSLKNVREIAMAANTVGILTEAFAGVMTGTRNLIVGREQEYINQVLKCSEGSTPETRKDKENELNVFAQNVINTVYNPTIKDIGGKHPKISTAVPTVGAPGGGGPPANFGGGGGGGAGGLKPGGLGTPELPSLNGLGGPTDPVGDQQGAPTTPTGAPQGGGGSGDGAGDAAKNAAGKAGDAANQAMNQGQKPGQQNPAGRLPEGVLGLGPKGLKGVAKAGGAGGARVGGGAADQARRPAAKPASQLAPTTKATASVPVSRAGVSGTGPAGAGTPAAGHRGGAAGKEHKANKALRHAKHGQQVVGDAEAVLPVIGDEPKEAVPAEPGRRN